jgi:ATP-dependent Clp protease ATP-binding subunit ClpA
MYRDELQKYLQSIFTKIESLYNDIILLIDQIHLIFCTENTEGKTELKPFDKKIIE